jgi:hypothetical protein
VTGGRVTRVRGVHIVDHFTDEAIGWLEHLDGRDPFFLQVNYDGPFVLPPTIVGPDRRNPHDAPFEGRAFRPFPPVDPAIIASLILPFDPHLDPHLREWSPATGCSPSATDPVGT